MCVGGPFTRSRHFGHWQGFIDLYFAYKMFQWPRQDMIFHQISCIFHIKKTNRDAYAVNVTSIQTSSICILNLSNINSFGLGEDGSS